MVAAIEIQDYAVGHEMSNRRSGKQSFPNTNLNRLGYTGHLRLCGWSALHWSMAAFAWLLSFWTAAFCVEIWAQNRRNYSPQFGKIILTRHYNFKSGIRTISSTVVASNTDKPTHTWWLASKFRTMQLVMKRRVTDQESRASPTQTWIAVGTLASQCFAGGLLWAEAWLLLHGCFRVGQLPFV